jgi:Domain of unknown function (DUF4340)
MNPRVTVGLLAVLIALGAYVYFGPQQATSGAPGSPGAPGATPTPQLDLWRVDDQQVASVTVAEAAGQAGVQRNGTDWALIPTGEPADSLRVNSLIFRLASLRATRRLDSVTSLDDYGLTTPALTATVKLADGSVHTLKFGGQAPAQSGTYALADADPTVYLVSNALAQDVERLVSDPPRQPPPSPSPSPSPGL